MTDKEIINALEICSSDAFNDSKERCTGCKYDGADKNLFCFEVLEKDALELINRLKVRIKRYQLKNTNQRNALASLNKKVAEQKAEIVRLNKKLDKSLEIATNFEADLNKQDTEIEDLKAEIEELKEENKKYREICEKAIKTYKETKSETIKEVFKKLEDKSIVCKVRLYDKGEFYPALTAVTMHDINKLKKEMTEGK